MKNIFILILIITLFSCKSKLKEVNSDPLIIKEDSIVLVPHQIGWTQEVVNPSKGEIRLKISNFTDSSKIFEVIIKEK